MPNPVSKCGRMQTPKPFNGFQEVFTVNSMYFCIGFTHSSYHVLNFVIRVNNRINNNNNKTCLSKSVKYDRASNKGRNVIELSGAKRVIFLGARLCCDLNVCDQVIPWE